ncbi:MAG: ribonuclease J [Desulfobacteraceae bacterium]|nr:ribonuclease J [Desulfobacteraceae bacterium]
MLKIIPLGGLGEIGLNMMIFEYGDTLFVVDAGLMFPEDHMLGVDYVIPDFTYLSANRKKVAGIVLTHAHEDHIGALPYLLRTIDAPVFGTPFTMGMVRHKLTEHGLLSHARLHEISPSVGIKFGEFELEFIRVGHSVVDGVGLAIRSPLGLVVHTGDFKINHSSLEAGGTDVNRFAQLGQEGVMALLSDSTNVEQPGYTSSDEEIGETLRKIAVTAQGRIIVALFASSITRIAQLVSIAADTGRKLVFDGRSIETSVSIARALGHLQVPAGMEIGITEASAYADSELMFVTTGSQGEPMAALARMASGNHRFIHIHAGDTVVLSSKFIPGNEKAITTIINNLYRHGADVIYEKISAIHVSGHAFREELKLMIRLTRPRYFIPIHGEFRHLIHHARLAVRMGIPDKNVVLAENGQIITIDTNGVQVNERVPTGRVLVDGKGIGDVGRSVLQERHLLSEEGLVVVNMAFDEETGIVIYGPEIVSKGFVFETETGHLLQDAICVVLEIVEEIGPEVPGRIDVIRKKVQSALRKYFSFTISRRPVILPFILEI